MLNYGAISLAVVNVVIWIAIYRFDFYQIQFFFDFGAMIVAVVSILWVKKDSNMKLRKLTYTINGIFLLMYLAFWIYIIIFAIGFSI